ncbi:MULTISPECIES: L,D-transpeptidase family protein [unclassified Pseudomonas]|uniref:L,D-transpeptidase family protein n=1 Tax=unclassified Pseudomonas TaxID=196821 RepID=UPI002AC944B6|nr:MULTISPECIES: L,D-transpeptidase family protein [unclassified Pseudomonas]MEB0047822.1 L,D-transpeptidase family protein [Pseudomonas sp. Dout3]MEB0098336.1 L,D-transpeptidase family protein [Pseudomonas sp. DC1.2]WPX57123.1 L,D-transpeptidase family protein [Pseudomonas sp. DC1.2]
MRQLSRLFVISHIFFMGFLISGAVRGETSSIEPVTPSGRVIEAAPGDNVGQAIHAVLEPLISAFPPLLTSPRHQRLDVNRVVMDFYVHRGFRAAWTEDSDVAQLLKSLNDTQIDGLEPADFRIDELASARASVQPPSATPAQRAAFDMAATRTYITALLQLRRGKVDPSRLDMHWNFDASGVDPREDVDAFFAALDSHEVARAFTLAPPQEAVYGGLREALAQLRKVRDRGGWPKVAEGQTLRPEMDDPAVAQLRARLAAGGYLEPQKSKRTDYDETVIAAVKKYQTEQYLGPDGVAGPTTLAALNVPVQARIDQVRVNMERARWLLYKLQGTFVVVDIAGYKVTLYRDGQPIWRSRVQVGKPFRSTPIFQAQITYVTFNPTWTVPPTILKEDMLPKILSNPNYLSANRIRAIDREGKVLDPLTVDWSNPRGITLRQDAGPENSLGQVVIRFPNDYAIYLHDTPHRELFAKSVRATSSGCIRVENPLQLVELLFNDPVRWNSAGIQKQLANGRTENIRLPVKVPVLLAYWTVDLGSNGRVAFKPDVYGYDIPVLKALNVPSKVPVLDLQAAAPLLSSEQRTR